MFRRRFGGLTDNATLADFANVTMGQSPTGSSYNEAGIGTIFYQGRAEFGWRYPTQRLSTTEPKRMAKAGDVLMSVRAPVGDLNLAYEDCCIGRGLAAIHCDYPSYGLYLMRSLHKKLDAYNGEGTVFGSINGKALNGLPIALPNNAAIRAFEKEAAPIDTQIRNNEVESRALVALRDTLLPKLMSGEIDVSKVNLTQLNSHLDAPSHRLPGHLTAPLIRVPRRKSSHPRRDLMCRNFSSFPRLGREQASQRHVKGPTALLPYRKIGRERWRNDNLQPATCGFVSGLRNYLPIFRQAAEPSSGEGHNLPHITKKSGPSWVPTRQFMVAGAGFEPTTFGL